MTKVHCIMLVDDNRDDNFFHERVIKKNLGADIVVVKESGPAALAFLKAGWEREQSYPDLIFLDINMPGMNGWEFIEEYEKLPEELTRKILVIMLTTSDNPVDRALAKEHAILGGFRTKPLTKEMLMDVLSMFSQR